MLLYCYLLNISVAVLGGEEVGDGLGVYQPGELRVGQDSQPGGPVQPRHQAGHAPGQTEGALILSFLSEITTGIVRHQIRSKSSAV